MADREIPSRNPEPAATIILVRQHHGVLQTYLLRRSPKLRFMAGMHVFPGGRVDPTDHDAQLWCDHMDLPPEQLPRRFGTDLTPEQALGFTVAAVRETYEEAGVLLAQDHSGVRPVTTELDHLRAADQLQSGWLAGGAVRGGWRLQISALQRWARWVTPCGMGRRYDTLFLLAQAPSDQDCSPDGRETDQGVWVSPAEALAKNQTGEIPLSPPTIVTLHELLEYANFDALETALPSHSARVTFAPRYVSLDRGSVIVEPWDPEFASAEIMISAGDLPTKLLPSGASFSRIWFNGSLWRPIAV